MENEGTNNKAKFITALVVIAAIAIIYLFSALRTHKADAISSASETPLTSTKASNPAPAPASSDSTSAAPAATYKAGTYSASGSYRTPQTNESINVSLSIAADGMVTDSSVQQTPASRESRLYQADFKDNYRQYVVGKKLADINIGRVSGSSLTSIGFKEALNQIESQAKQD
jgi:hypothetical protein